MERDMFNFNSQSPHRYHSGDARGGAPDTYTGGYYNPKCTDQSQALRCWRKVKCHGDRPGARSGAASVIVDDKMYLFGGYGGSGRLDDFYCFDFESKRWSPVTYLSPSPGVRENNGVVEYKGSLYLFGGYNGSAWLNDFHRFDLRTLCWHAVEPLGAPPASRFGYVSVVHRDQFLLFGGYDGATWLNDTHAFDFKTRLWTQVQTTGQVPSIRSCPSWCKEGSKVYVFGGYDGVRRMNDFFVLDLDTNVWSELPCGGAPGDVPSPRYFHACAMHGGSLYTFGGYNGSERLNDMYTYDFAALSWKQVHGDSLQVAAQAARAHDFQGGHGAASGPHGDHGHGGRLGGAEGAELQAAAAAEASSAAASGHHGSRGSLLHPATTAPHSPSSSAAAYAAGLPSPPRLQGGTGEGRGAGPAVPPPTPPRDRRGNGGGFSSSYSSASPWSSDDVPSGRSSLVSVVYKNSLFVFGGYNGQVVLNNFYEFRFEPVLVPPPSLLGDLRSLVNNEDLSDVTFLVEGQPVYASRIHLAARSEHFRAMLFGGMREAFLPRSRGASTLKGAAPLTRAPKAARRSAAGSDEDGEGDCDPHADCIVVEDVSHAVFVKMLEFLYTDDVEEIPPEMAVPLLIAGERWMLPRLKGLCEEAIRRGITAANVVPTFLAAHRHRAAGLKAMCLDFLLDHLDEAKGMPAFAELKAEPELLMEIIMRGA